MSILSLAIWVSAFLGLLAVGISQLPDASDHPYPPEITESINNLWDLTQGINSFFPLDTWMVILGLSFTVLVTIKLVIPTLFIILNYIRGNT